MFPRRIIESSLAAVRRSSHNQLPPSLMVGCLLFFKIIKLPSNKFFKILLFFSIFLKIKGYYLQIIFDTRIIFKSVDKVNDILSIKITQIQIINLLPIWL